MTKEMDSNLLCMWRMRKNGHHFTDTLIYKRILENVTRFVSGAYADRALKDILWAQPRSPARDFYTLPSRASRNFSALKEAVTVITEYGLAIP